MSKIRVVMRPGEYLVYKIIGAIVAIAILAALLPYILIGAAIIAAVVGVVLIVRHVKKKNKGE